MAHKTASALLTRRHFRPQKSPRNAERQDADKVTRLTNVEKACEQGNLPAAEFVAKTFLPIFDHQNDRHRRLASRWTCSLATGFDYPIMLYYPPQEAKIATDLFGSGQFLRSWALSALWRPAMRGERSPFHTSGPRGLAARGAAAQECFAHVRQQRDERQQRAERGGKGRGGGQQPRQQAGGQQQKP